VELRQLRYLVTASREASFTRAAARMHVAQPAVSAQIRRLERELGQPLLERTPRGVRLTGAGASVLPHARAALAAIQAARLAVDEHTGLLRGHVTLGVVGQFAAPALDVPGLLADFHRRHPAIQITLREADAATLLESLRLRSVDAAFVGLAASVPPGIAVHVIVDEPLYAAVHPDDPLAARTSVTLSALQNRELISLPRGTGLRAVIDEAAAAAGLTLRIAFEASAPVVVARLAGRGLGVALLPESAARAHPRQLHPLPIVRPRMRGRVALAWPADGPGNPAAAVLVRLARHRFPVSAPRRH